MLQHSPSDFFVKEMILNYSFAYCLFLARYLLCFLFDLENGCRTFLCNFGEILLNCTASYPRQLTIFIILNLEMEYSDGKQREIAQVHANDKLKYMHC